MTAFTDRADAFEAAIRDIARDLEADLGKLARYRGSHPTTPDGPWFRDPGPDLATYEQQKATMPGRVHTISRYKRALSQARDTIPTDATNGPEQARRAELVDLIAAVTAITTYDDAVALVASFEEGGQ